jgi:hypothetical protein
MESSNDSCDGGLSTAVLQSVIRCGTADLAWLRSVVRDGAIRHVTWVSSWWAGFDSNGQTSEFPEWCSCRAPLPAFDRRIVPPTYLAFLLHACWPRRADERRGRCRFIFIEYVLVDAVDNVAKLMFGR